MGNVGAWSRVRPLVARGVGSPALKEREGGVTGLGGGDGDGGGD